MAVLDRYGPQHQDCGIIVHVVAGGVHVGHYIK